MPQYCVGFVAEQHNYAARKNVNLEDGTKPPGEKFAVDSVAIADDVAWCPFPAAGFDELSGHPFSARVCRYAEP